MKRKLWFLSSALFICLLLFIFRGQIYRTVVKYRVEADRVESVLIPIEIKNHLDSIAILKLNSIEEIISFSLKTTAEMYFV